MMKKEVKVERSRWTSTEGAYEVNRGEEAAEEGSALLMRRKEREWRGGMQKSDVWKSK